MYFTAVARGTDVSRAILVAIAICEQSPQETRDLLDLLRRNLASLSAR
jgi:hypothetical protein